MTEDQVKRAFDESTALFDFQFSREDFTKVTSLFSFDKSELFQIVGDADGIHIKTDAFDIVVDDTKRTEEKTTKSSFKSFLDKVDKETYTISVCESKLIMKSQESSTLIALNLAITE